MLSFHTRSGPAEAEKALLTGGPSRVIHWDDAGHWLQQEHWVEFNAIVSEWLDALHLSHIRIGRGSFSG